MADANPPQNYGFKEGEQVLVTFDGQPHTGRVIQIDTRPGYVHHDERYLVRFGARLLWMAESYLVKQQPFYLPE